MKKKISFQINGSERAVDADVNQSLLELLRDEYGLTSIKQGCGVGECGACTVLVDGVAVDSCLFLSVWIDGKSVRTVEGEAKEGELTELQKQFLDEGAVQCGFCTTGFIMAGTAMIEKSRDQNMEREEIRKGLSGNLCRCTGYDSIILATEKALNKKHGCCNKKAD